MIELFWVLLAILLFVIAYVVWGVYKVNQIDKTNYAQFWQRLAREAVPDTAIRLLALGDSTIQGIGATNPLKGTVGRVAHHIEKATNRPVFITNLSVTGAKAHDVAHNQLDAAAIDAADIIIVAVGANDAVKKSDIVTFERVIKKICAILPAEKTIMADVAMVKNRDPYERLLNQYRSEKGIYDANLRFGFRNVKQPWRLSARDFFHPSDYGYEFWYKAFCPSLDELIAANQLAK